MAIGREGLRTRQFEDPYAGVTKATHPAYLDTVMTTYLGPVPQGRVWRVLGIHFYVSAFAFRTATSQFVQDNGTGHVFPYQALALNVLNGTRHIPVPTIVGQSEVYPQAVYHMEEGDVFQSKMNLVLALPLYTSIHFHYQDIRQ